MFAFEDLITATVFTGWNENSHFLEALHRREMQQQQQQQQKTISVFLRKPWDAAVNMITFRLWWAQIIWNSWHVGYHRSDRLPKGTAMLLTWQRWFVVSFGCLGEPGGMWQMWGALCSPATSLPDTGHPRSAPLHNQSVSSPPHSPTFLTTCYTPTPQSVLCRSLSLSLYPPTFPCFSKSPPLSPFICSLSLFYPPPHPALFL